MGEVYLAHDAMLQRNVAVKTVRAAPGLIREEFNTRFLNEARCVAALTHPNIVPVYDMGIEDGEPYLVMEVVPGPSLRQRIERSGPLSARSVRMLGIQIANALAAAHRAGIVHRDVKPANLLQLDEDQWKLVDFGVARVPDSSLTEVGQFLGTPAYAAPETLEGGAFDAASDVYGLGATLYEALAGGPPHGIGNAVQLAVRVIGGPPVPIQERVPDVPRELAELIMAALARDPAKRPSADTLARSLAAACATRPDVTPVPPRPRRARWAVGAAFAIGGAAAAWALVAYEEPAVAVAETEPRAEAEPAADSEIAELAGLLEPAEEPDPEPAEDPELEPAEEPELERAEEPEPEPEPAGLLHAVGEPEPGLKGLADVERLVRRGAKTQAIRKLDALRRAQPKSGYLAYRQGQLYFERMWWKDGFDAYGAAIAADPRYRAHPPLIRDVLRNLSSKSQSWRGSRFLVQRIGKPAVPQLEQAVAATRSAKIRSRMQRTLSKLRGDG